MYERGSFLPVSLPFHIAVFILHCSFFVTLVIYTFPVSLPRLSSSTLFFTPFPHHHHHHHQHHQHHQHQHQHLLSLIRSARPEITVTIAAESDRAAAALTSDAATLSKSASVRICAPSPTNEVHYAARMCVRESAIALVDYQAVVFFVNRHSIFHQNKLHANRQNRMLVPSREHV